LEEAEDVVEDVEVMACPWVEDVEIEAAGVEAAEAAEAAEAEVRAEWVEDVEAAAADTIKHINV